MSQKPKTMAEIDKYRFDHAVDGQVQSRYHTLVRFYGEVKADRIMRELEVASWDLSGMKKARE